MRKILFQGNQGDCYKFLAFLRDSNTVLPDLLVIDVVEAVHAGPYTVVPLQLAVQLTIGAAVDHVPRILQCYIRPGYTIAPRQGDGFNTWRK